MDGQGTRLEACFRASDSKSRGVAFRKGLHVHGMGTVCRGRLMGLGREREGVCGQRSGVLNHSTFTGLPWVQNAELDGVGAHR